MRFISEIRYWQRRDRYLRRRKNRACRHRDAFARNGLRGCPRLYGLRTFFFYLNLYPELSRLFVWECLKAYPVNDDLHRALEAHAQTLP